MSSSGAQSKKGRSFGAVITNRAPNKNLASPSATESEASCRGSNKRRIRPKLKKQVVCLVDNDGDAFLKRSCSATPRISNASKGIQRSLSASKKRKKIGTEYLQSETVKKMKDSSYPRPQALLCEMPSIPEENGENMDCESDEGSLGSFSGSPEGDEAQFDTEFILRPPFASQRSMLAKNPAWSKSLLSSENVRFPHRIISPKFQKFTKSDFQELFDTPAPAVATLKIAKKSTPFIETPRREETQRKYSEPAWSSWRREAANSRQSDAIIDAEKRNLESSLSPAEGKSFITRMLEEARMTPVDNVEVMDAMLSTSCGVYHNGSVVGTMIGGAELRRSPSLDDSEVTMRTWEKADNTNAEKRISRQKYKSPALIFSNVESPCSSVIDMRPTLVAHILTSKGREKEWTETRDVSSVKLKLTSMAKQNTPHEEVVRHQRTPEQQVNNDNNREKEIPAFIETPVLNNHVKKRVKVTSLLRDFSNDSDISPHDITAYNTKDRGKINESPPFRLRTTAAKSYRTIREEGKHHFDSATKSSQRSVQSSVRRDDGSIVVKLEEPSVTFKQVIYFQVGDDLIPHPPLPSGWQIRISESKNRPFYCHPDHGTTWHCPVVLPRSRAPNSLRIRAESYSEVAGNSIQSVDSTSSKDASTKNSIISSVECDSFANTNRPQQSHSISAYGDDESSSLDDQTASTAPSTVMSSPEDSLVTNPMKGWAPERILLNRNALEGHWSPGEEHDLLSSEQTLSLTSCAKETDEVDTLNSRLEIMATLGMKRNQICRSSIINHLSEKTNDSQRLKEQSNTEIDGIIKVGDPALAKHGSSEDQENRVKVPELILTHDENKSQFCVHRGNVFIEPNDNKRSDVTPTLPLRCEASAFRCEEMEQQKSVHTQPNEKKRSNVTPILPLPCEAFAFRCDDMEQLKPVQEPAVSGNNKLEYVAIEHAREDATDSSRGNSQGSPTVEKCTHADTIDFPIDSGSYSSNDEYPSNCLNSTTDPVNVARSQSRSNLEKTSTDDSDNEEQNELCKGLGHDEEFESSKVIARHLSISPHDDSHTQRWRSDHAPKVDSPMNSFGGHVSLDDAVKSAASSRIRNPPHPLCALQRLGLIRAIELAAKDRQKVKKRYKRAPKASEKPSESFLIDPAVRRLVF